MVDKDIVFAKIGSIQWCLRRIHEVTKGNPESLDNLDVEEIVTLNLQRAVQGSIDLAAHVVADEGWGVPQELRENFDLLLKNKVIDSELTNRLRKMVGFRNIAVHEYDTINVEILKSVVRDNLKDIEDFYMSVLRHLSLDPE